MARLGFALLLAHEQGASISILSERLNLPEDWVRERIEAARLSIETPLPELTGYPVQ